MRIKKHSNGNEYLLTPQNKWVRNFTKNSGSFIDINNTISEKDHFTFLKNETKNNFRRYQWIDSEDLFHDKICIVSDGFDFARKQKILSELPKDVTILAVNGALAKWDVKSRSPNYYIVNNPYSECMKYLPRNLNVFPKCIASPRTNFEFLEAYRGMKFKYYPANEQSYTTNGLKEVSWQIDDYRNPICAAIGLAYKFGVQKILLFCCDDVFKDERPGAVKLENNLWMYPQQEVAHGLIDASLYWLTHQNYSKVIASDHSLGPNYENATYIKEEDINSFFGNEAYEYNQ
jgi:hypothetical protein